ncbi:hypothetical protein T484DRAFT_1818880, partial [Baffinella frigidus]
VETAHVHAAEALRRAADPGAPGLFELASPFILRELPHHVVRGRRWGMLRAVLCNISFLAQASHTLGLETVLAFFAGAVRAIDSSGEAADDALAARRLMVAHAEFVAALSDAYPGGGPTSRQVCLAALAARLPGVEDVQYRTRHASSRFS